MAEPNRISEDNAARIANGIRDARLISQNTPESAGEARVANASGAAAFAELRARLAREQPADPRMVGSPTPDRPVPMERRK